MEGHQLGWIGTGRMGSNMVARLLASGHDVSVYNRTRAKAEPLAQLGATVVDSPADLGHCQIVFTMVTGPTDFEEIILGPQGVVSGSDPETRIIVDCSTISLAASAAVREHLSARSIELLAAPVSGNPQVVEGGKLTVVASGPRSVYDEVKPYLGALGQESTYVGEGELARAAKICHNLMLGVVSQCLAEITVLAEKSGMARADFLEFLNRSVMGSTFSRYKTPAMVNLDFTPTFTPMLLRKDFDLGFALAHDHDVPMPVAAAASQAVEALIGSGYVDSDFAALLELAAKQSGLDLKPEEVAVGDGLATTDDAVTV